MKLPQTPTRSKKSFSTDAGASLLGRPTLNNRLTAPSDRLVRQIEATDQRIDRLVYELYGLTEEEIGIVEEGAR